MSAVTDLLLKKNRDCILPITQQRLSRKGI